MKAATAKAAVGFRNILYATDFSIAAANAIPCVKRITKHYEAHLVATLNQLLANVAAASAILDGARVYGSLLGAWVWCDYIFVRPLVNTADL